MAETLREFLVSFQFAAGDSARAEADAAAAAKRVTATDAAALGQREKNALEAIGRMAGAYDKARTETDKKNSESEKRSRDARDAAISVVRERALGGGPIRGAEVDDAALLGIAQHLVRGADVLELRLRLRVRVHVGMQFSGQLAVGAFDLGIACAPAHTEQPVIVACHADLA